MFGSSGRGRGRGAIAGQRRAAAAGGVNLAKLLAGARCERSVSVHTAKLLARARAKLSALRRLRPSVRVQRVT